MNHGLKYFEILGFTQIQEIPQAILTSFIDLHTQLFGAAYSENLDCELRAKGGLLILLAVSVDSHQVIGFKIGYALNQAEFYSWTGGIAPNYRRLGIAEKLSQVQHEWCLKSGFKRVKTRTKEIWPEMLNLNFKIGFTIDETTKNQKNEAIIWLSKNLR